MTNLEDPYFMVKEEINSSISHLNGLFQSWNRILKVARSTENEELIKTTEELKSVMLMTNGTLDDLQDSIDIAKSQPRKFNVTEKDLEQRQNFVDKTRVVIQEIDSTISNPLIIKNAMASKSSHIVEMEPLNSSNEASQSFTAQNQLILEQQDQQLDSIMGTVQSLRDIAFTVGNELDDHQEMLEEIDLRMDSTQDKLGNAMRKVKGILERTQNMKSSYLIILLIIALSILALLLFVS